MSALGVHHNPIVSCVLAAQGWYATLIKFDMLAFLAPLLASPALAMGTSRISFSELCLRLFTKILNRRSPVVTAKHCLSAAGLRVYCPRAFATGRLLSDKSICNNRITVLRLLVDQTAAFVFRCMWWQTKRSSITKKQPHIWNSIFSGHGPACCKTWFGYINSSNKSFWSAIWCRVCFASGRRGACQIRQHAEFRARRTAQIQDTITRLNCKSHRCCCRGRIDPINLTFEIC
mmetsp:Transcript_29453/g.68276  ORF Transcript_29453/g.68276 Transcript_29453/m.68276 type:complete len:232 (+) Transcript_29453:376-1071(+)